MSVSPVSERSDGQEEAGGGWRRGREAERGRQRCFVTLRHDGWRRKVVEEETSSIFKEMNITKCITLTDNQYSISMIS